VHKGFSVTRLALERGSKRLLPGSSGPPHAHRLGRPRARTGRSWGRGGWWFGEPSYASGSAALAHLIVLSQGRLVVYRPEADFSGTDLHVTLLHGEAVLKIQVKGRTTLAQDRQMPVQVLSTQIPDGDPKQLLFVGYDLKAAEPREWIWLVPSDFYRAHSNLIKGYYKAGLATKPTAADKWVDFRHNTRDIAWVVEEMLKRE
jgi:hypothetical protein